MADIEVAVIGSHPALSEAICEGLTAYEDLHAIAADSYIDNIAEFVAVQHPDVLVLDAEMARTNDGQILRQLHESSSWPAIVLLSDHDNPEQIDVAVRRGALAFVLKVPPAEELADAIRYAIHGEMWISPPLLTEVLAAERDGDDAVLITGRFEPDPAVVAPDPLGQLSPDERTVLDLLVEGIDRFQIASKMYLSGRDVERHLERIRHKFATRSSHGDLSYTSKPHVAEQR